ncbi:MAG TPA: phytanoyl-CoA dioxygenase family protein [Dongiaceae bacterium]|nr:phytanoyl-CoA dioxygenase family protein [Dongiaceae bacterium]
MPHAYHVTQDQIEAYDRDGVVLLPGLLNGDEVATMQEASERILGEETNGARNYFKRLRMWERDPGFHDLVFKSALGDAAAQLVQADKINLLYDQLFIKEPGSNFSTPWHNDHPYWPVRGKQVVTLWIALDPVTLSNGGLEFVRGSHKQSRWYRPFTTDLKGYVVANYGKDGDEYEDVPDIEGNRDKYDIVSFDLKPGDAIAFHSLMLHGAPGNTTATTRRRGVSVRVAGSDVVYFDGPVWNEDITNPTLKGGDPLDSKQYPVIYRAS